MPDSHQETNAKVFAQACAAIVLDQDKISDQEFVNAIHGLINNKNKQEELSAKIQKVIKKGANQELVSVIKELLNC
jgi:UDP-N-acetylglucosamine:LPS N-acetylglucosamine transferase